MPIRILPEQEIKSKASLFHRPCLLFANPKHIYQRRANRLRQLAQNHPFADYLNFVARICDSQLAILNSNPLQTQKHHFNSLHPLDIHHWQRSPKWREYLSQLLTAFKTDNNPSLKATINCLENSTAQQLENLADHLLRQDYTKVASDQAIFIWAALSLYWLQLTTQIPHYSQQENAQNLQHCPVCNSAPVASVVHFADSQGLRYLHCSLCETQWNLVRAQCTCCNQSGHLDFWSLDNELAPVRAESCGDCASYLKIMFQDKDPHLEVVADDLATIYLDFAMEQKNYLRSGLNPFMFPAD